MIFDFTYKENNNMDHFKMMNNIKKIQFKLISITSIYKLSYLLQVFINYHKYLLITTSIY